MGLALSLENAKNEIKVDAGTVGPSLTKSSNTTERSRLSFLPENVEEIIFSKTFLHSDVHSEFGSVVFQMLLD